MLNRQCNKITWLAGLLEGEGWFGNKKGYAYPQIQLSMTDLDTVQKARDIIDSSIKISSRSRENIKTMHKIELNGQLAVEWMMTLYVLMSSRRKEKIREILQTWRTNVDKRTLTNHITDEMREQALIVKKSGDIVRRNNKLVDLIMMSRNDVSREEAEKMVEESLASFKKQTIQ